VAGAKDLKALEIQIAALTRAINELKNRP
jgi:hypothetical protein